MGFVLRSLCIPKHLFLGRSEPIFLLTIFGHFPFLHSLMLPFLLKFFFTFAALFFFFFFAAISHLHFISKAFTRAAWAAVFEHVERILIRPAASA